MILNKTYLILIVILISTKAFGQISIDAQYRNGAGYFQAYEAGIKLDLKKGYGVFRGFNATDFGNSSRADSSSKGISIGAGYSFKIVSRLSLGGEINMRINDLNGTNGDQFLSPQLYLGYDLRWFEIQLNLGVPYFFGLGINIPLKT
tara:strand:+ start:1184 stop:1624 length:441 start_codon:yes stop_codon:yes gene_type:complete